MKGCYVLLIELKEDREILFGRRRRQYFKKGFYLYVGSALNGLENRINRHLSKKKKLYWHIDYLLQYANVISVFYIESTTRMECLIAESLSKKLSSTVVGFGCSDCNCKSHLFYGSKKKLLSLINELKMLKYKEERQT